MTKPNARLQNGSPEPEDEEDDIGLISFLKANAPPVPAPGLGLEDQLMQAISKEIPASGQHPSRPGYRWNSSIAALMGLGVVGAVAVGWGQLQAWFGPPGVSSAELAQVESFMVSDWSETVLPNEPSKDWEWLDARLMPAAMPAATSASAQATDSSVSHHSRL